MNIMDNIVRCISVRKERIRNTFAESNSIRRMDLLFWAFTPHNFSLGQIASVNISSYGFGVRCVYVKKGSPIIDMLKAMIIAEKERAELLTTASESSLIVLEPRKASRL